MINIEEYLNHLLQQDIDFSIDGKNVKHGKLLLFTVKDFYITFFLKCGVEQKRYELPYPFTITKTANGIVFDYTLNALAVGNDELLCKLRSLSRKKFTKIYDSVVHITSKF